VQKDLVAINLEFEEYAKYCDDEATSKDYATKSSTEQIEALSSSVEDSSAKISYLAEKIDGLSMSIGGADGELSKAVSLLKKEEDNFQATE